MLAFRYVHPRSGAEVEIRQAVRVAQGLPGKDSQRRPPRRNIPVPQDTPVRLAG